MKLTVRGNKLEVTDSIRNYVEEKLGKLDKYFEEADEINASTGFINKDSVLNDGQLTDEEKSNLESFACNDNSCENPNGDDDGGNTPSATSIIIENTDAEFSSNVNDK